MPIRNATLRDLAKSSAGLWLVVALAIVLLGTRRLTAGQSVLAMLGGGLAATGLTIAVLGSRAQKLSRVEAAAKQIASTSLPRPDSPNLPADPAAPIDRFGEFASLYNALDELGQRIALQLKEVAKKTRNLEALIDAMDEPLLATDNEERVLLCNRSAEEIFAPELARSSLGLVGRPIAELFTQAELLEMHGAARAGETRRGRVRVTTSLGQRVFQVSALPVPVAWGQGVFGAVMVLRDVTELDQAVEIKTDFVANASHELRTPVAAIRGAAETLAEVANDDPKMADRLRGMILTHSIRLEELLRDLLDLSRLESPDVPVQTAPVDLDEVERSLRSNFEPVCRERNLDLLFEIEGDLRGMQTDRKLFLLIMRNLVENATKFAHEGTTIRILGSLIEEELSPENRAGGAPLRRAGVARFEVVDRGVGVPLAMQDRVFERFFQVDAARTGAASAKRGTGLGLAIVKHAAKAVGGRAGLTSVWGEGTTAFVEFPVEFAPTPQASRP